jgi:hypothetical protein
MGARSVRDPISFGPKRPPKTDQRAELRERFAVAFGLKPRPESELEPLDEEEQ